MNESLSNHNYAELITIATREDDASEIESFLREAGLPVRMTWLKPDAKLSEKLKSIKPDIAFCDSKVLQEHPDTLKVATRTLPYTPLLLLTEEINIDMVSEVMQQRARDVVSVNHPDHLRAVYLRELGVCRLNQQVYEAGNKVEALEERLAGMVKASEAAVVNIQEGIIVDANPRFASLFGYESPADAVGLPFMDLVHSDNQADIKKVMSRCLKGRIMAAHSDIKAVNINGPVFDAGLEIKLVQFDDEPALECQIKAEAPEEKKTETIKTPAESSQEMPKVKTGSDEPELDQRTLLYKSLENKKHYAPTGTGLSLGYVVADNSAKIKEQLGLANAEAFLGRIPSFLQKQMPGAKTFRLSTDEFVLLAPGKLFKHGDALAKNFCKQISGEVFDYDGKSVVMTVSVALSLIDSPKNSGIRFAEARDDARKLSKEGGNRHMICASAVNAEQTSEPIKWEMLQSALEKNRIRIATRPVSSLEGDDRHYYQLEARIPDSKGNLIEIEAGGPQDTDPKLQRAVDQKLVMLAMGTLKKLADSGQKAAAFIPVSSCSLEQADKTFTWLEDQHQKLGLKDQHLIFTLSESVLTPHIHRLKELVKKYGDSPFKFAITECAGTEESLRLIQHIKGHFLHLTQKATRGLTDTKNEGLHEAVSMAREQGYKIIAAAPVDAHTMAVLWQLGVNYVQGSEIDEPAAA